MASAATLFQQTLNTPRTTVGQFVGKVSAAVNFSFATPSLVPQVSRGIGAAQSFELTNRYSIFITAALIKPCATKRMRGGCFGPFTVAWNDGNAAMTYNVGYNGVNVMQGTGSALPVPGNVPGTMNSMMAGHFTFVAAPGTTIRVTSPFSGDAVYAVNIALETF
jgi:hypothetical protein